MERKIRTGDPIRVYEVIGSGRNAYLWMGDKDGEWVATITGTETLRTFANEILSALPPHKESR